MALWLAFLGCGDVQFHLSPYTPKNVELISSPQEHVSVVRWRVDAPPPVEDTHFELWSPAGYREIVFKDSVFPGGIKDCGDGVGACAQYVTREKLTAPKGYPLVRAVHSRYGVLPGADALSRSFDDPSDQVGMDSFFNARNDAVYINILQDRIAAGGPYLFPRSFERAMWATNGSCAANSPPEGVSFSPLSETGGFPPELPLTENGMYCVATRPIPTDGGNRIMLQKRVATRAEIVTKQVRYAPPIETSPIIYQIVVDLDIYSPGRCTETLQGIEDVVRQYLRPFGTAVEVRQLPTINIATGPLGDCHQEQIRKIPSEAMAQEIKRAVAEFPQVYQQFHLLYFNNLAISLPGTLTQSFHTLLDALQGAPAGHELTTYPWLFNPGIAAASDLGWKNFTPWASVDDPNFIGEIVNYASHLPYRTQRHDYDEPIPLLSAEEAAAHADHLMKLCLSSPFAIPVTTKPTLQAITTISWPISADDPPAYLVTIPEQIAEPVGDFIETESLVEYQICTRYCVDHPFVPTTGVLEDGKSWATSTACVKD